MTQKAFQYRFYPTPEQENLLRRTLGCTRLVYNRALADRTSAWYEEHKRVGYGETSAMLTQWKQQEDLQFLNEVSCVPLQQGLRHLQKAFSNFFAGRSAYPNFKKKRNGGSAEFTKSAFKFKEGFNAKRAKLKKAQKRYERKLKGSKNREKARLKVAKVHQEIADTRKDFLHKLTTQLVRENQTIAVEDLAVKNMVKNHPPLETPPLVRGVGGCDCAWGELVRQLEYKCDWSGRTLVKIDRWFPSSKRCSECGYITEKMPLNLREWECPSCGTEHDRDVNASVNILAAGLAVSVCGATVRPEQNKSVRAGAVKQKPKS